MAEPPILNVLLPKRTLHGLVGLQLTPIVRADPLFVTIRSVSWLAEEAPPAPPSRFQVFCAVQAYRFCPAGALVKKNNCSIEQVTGSELPLWIGLVDVADEKSIFWLWFRRSTRV